jgi:patatin-like phospholipase/acyl hydrolase
MSAANATELNPCQILSLDGGGLKGIFSAAVLAHVEADLGINICDHFDLIVGTSTGGIIAIGLALGLRPKEILDFYLNEGPTIFPQGFTASPLRRFRHWFLNKFDVAVLEKALRCTFGDRKLGDCMKRLVIPSFSLEANDVYLFKTPHHPRLRRDLHVPAWQAALATASAPTFFQAAKAPDHQRLVDGGIWANNPSLVGLTEAHATLACPLEQVSILNIGTSTECKEWPKRRDWGGKISWAADVADLIMSSQSQAISKQCGLLLRKRFYRLDIQVPAGAFALDRYDNQKLMARAAHATRHAIPNIEGFFCHRSTPFDPKVDQERTITC